jgi:hypothetical protein
MEVGIMPRVTRRHYDPTPSILRKLHAENSDAQLASIDVAVSSSEAAADNQLTVLASGETAVFGGSDGQAGVDELKSESDAVDLPNMAGCFGVIASVEHEEKRDPADPCHATHHRRWRSHAVGPPAPIRQSADMMTVPI